MGEVYLAADPRLGRQVAIKVLNSQAAAAGSSRERFRNEAQMAAVLRPEEICATRVRESVKLAESPALALDVFRHAPGSHGAHDYRALIEELQGAGFLR